MDDDNLAERVHSTTGFPAATLAHTPAHVIRNGSQTFLASVLLFS